MLKPGTPTVSSFCGTQACVEVTDLAGAVQVRDTKDGGGGSTTFTTADWRAFGAALKAGLIEKEERRG